MTAKQKMLKTVGTPALHDSATLHVQGNATYIDDMREPAGLLHVVPGYVKDGAKGKLVSVDLSDVKNAPGVIAVLTHVDIPGVNDCSPAMGDDPIFAMTEISFHGQVVFAVVAETRDAARRAAKLAKINLAAETPAVTIGDALQSPAPDILPAYAFKRGNAAQAITRSTHQLENSFEIGGQEHFYLEGQVSLAIPGEQGAMTIHCSTQHPTEVQHIIAKMLNVTDAKITCECRRMGGGFGGKESQASQWAALAALAAHITGRPAKCRLDRDDDMMMTGKRHDMRVNYSAGFSDKGVLNAVDVEFLSRCGYSVDLSQGVNDRAMFHADNAYFYPALHIKSRRLRTNTVSNTAFRGFGGPQGMLFAEHMLSAIAAKLKIDPLIIRKRNIYSASRNKTPYGQIVTDSILNAIISQLEVSSNYQKRRAEIDTFNASSRIVKKGLALTPLKFGISFTLKHMNQAGALLNVYTDGSVQLNHGGTEMGQGLYIKVAQIIAEEFGLPLDLIQITATSTAKVPNTSPTAASSGADLNGMAAQNAAIEIKSRMAKYLAKYWGVAKSKIEFSNGKITAGKRSISFAACCKACHAERVSLSSTGFYATPKLQWDRAKAKGRPFLYFAYGAACSEVTIDTFTGEMKVDRVDILHDVGKSLNPAIDIGQIEGAFVQGMGWLTTEELVFDENAKLRTHAPSTYKIPCASDVPAEFNVSLFQSKGNQEATIYRSKAVGEPPLMLGISVWAAIFDAVASLRPGQVPKLDTPATPENIMRAVKAMRS